MKSRGLAPAVLVATLLLASCTESRSPAPGPGTPTAAETEPIEAGSSSTTPATATIVTLHVAGMMKSTGGAT